MLYIYKLYNYGILLLHTDTYIGKKSLDDKITNSTNITNYGQIRFFGGKNLNKITIYQSITNSGELYFYCPTEIFCGRISNDENGLISIEPGITLTFNYNVVYSPRSGTFENGHDLYWVFLIENSSQSKIIMKKNSKLIFSTSTVSDTDSNPRQFHIINNYGIVKLDGSIVNNTGQKQDVCNLEHSIIYLQNDMNLENIIFINYGDVIDMDDKDNFRFYPSLMNYDSETNTEGHILYTWTMEYKKGNGEPQKLYGKLNLICSFLFELNSLVIEPDTFNTIIYLLTILYLTKSNDEFSTNNQISQLIPLIKILIGDSAGDTMNKLKEILNKLNEILNNTKIIGLSSLISQKPLPPPPKPHPHCHPPCPCCGKIESCKCHCKHDECIMKRKLLK